MNNKQIEKLTDVVGKLCDISNGYKLNNDEAEAAATMLVANTLDELIDDGAIRKPQALKNPEMKLEMILSDLDGVLKELEDEKTKVILKNAYSSLNAVYDLYK